MNIKNCILSLKEEKIKFKDSALLLQNFTGEMLYFPNKTIFLNGKVESVRLDDVQIYPKEIFGSVSIHGNCVIARFNASNIESSFTVIASGVVNTLKTSVALVNDTITITDFSGNVSGSENVKFSGMVNELHVIGKEEILVT